MRIDLLILRRDVHIKLHMVNYVPDCIHGIRNRLEDITFNSCFHREIEYSYKTNISSYDTNNITSISFYLYANPIAKEDRDIKGIECRDQ